MTYDLKYRVRYFAQEYTKTKIGVYKHQTNPDAIYKQCLQGKMAEWAVYYYLRLIGHCPVSPPTMKVLDRPNWDCDLETDKFKIAVKCCPSWNLNTRHAYSWTFQAGQKRKDPILLVDSNRYIVFFVACLSEFEHEIYGSSTTKRLKETNSYIFEDGIDKATLKGEKLFVKAHKTEAIKEIRKIARF